ncbi:MAG TPA: ABC transporter permease [Thermoanaerobaculia bacterium]|nr:ABC transporter permease [Thermoanaerobaculia bacterium]
MSSILRDLRYALRSLRQCPGFTAIALATLAIGIGANAAIFSVLDAALLQPLPYPASDRLILFGDRQAAGGANNVGFATFADFRDQSRALQSAAVIRLWQPTLSEGGEAERIPGMRVSANYFDLLGVRTALGRGFQATDDRPDSWRKIVLSDALWRRRFGSDPAVVGRKIRMHDQDFEIIGVMPASFEPLLSAHFYRPAQLWATLGYDATTPNACRSCQHLKAIGRLNEGVTLAQAREDLDGIRRRLAAEHPSDYPAGSMAVVPFRDELAGPVRPALSILAGAVGFVLLIACANIANLLLARSLRRRHEMAVRAALGASRGQLVRQLLIESLVLAAAGGALGVALASLGGAALIRLAPATLPRIDHAGVDPRVLIFACALTIGSALFFGIAPALKASSAGLSGALALDGRKSSGSSASRGRRALVAAELALALVLLAAAGLSLKSLGRLLEAPLGFRSEGVLTLALSLDGNSYEKDEQVVAFQQRLLERARAVPGVEAVALAGQIPLGGNGDSWGFHIEGRITANPAEDPAVERYSVTADYFRVMGIPVKRGRLVTDEDRAGSLPVVVISQSTADALWPGQDPIGHRVRIGGATSGDWRTVVGVAGNVRHAGLSAEPGLQMYLPQAQVTDGFLVLVARAADPRGLAAPLRRAVRELDPSVPIYDVATMDELVARAAAEPRFVMRLLSGFAALALALAAIGLYGVVAYAVAERRREIGIRIALGATPRDVQRLVLRTGATTVAFGLLAGLVASFVLLRLLQSVLFGVGAHDPVTLSCAGALLALVALAAHWGPIRQARRVDPMASLRAD